MSISWERWFQMPSDYTTRPRNIKQNNMEMKAKEEEVTPKENYSKNNSFGEAATLELTGNYCREKTADKSAILLESKAAQRTLKVGCKGDDVTRLQQNLNTLGFNCGKPDGVFGNGTKNAVIAFQKAKGLTADGIVGAGTQNAITRALNEKNDNGVLKIGSKGAKVTELQRNLNTIGYSCGTPDGDFGKGTQNEVIRFQKTYGLTADGQAGKATQEAISVTVNRKAKGILSRGQVSNDIKSLQNDLKTLGYLSGNADGAFGVGTENAVKSFQKAHGLTQDGLVGSTTRNQITAAVKAKQEKENNILKLGSKGEKVRTLQENLKKLGYNVGTPDGDFGSKTQEAVQKFQKTYGLNPDGQAGPNTQSAISKVINYKNNKILSRGQISSEVADVQANLKKLGLLSGSADGVFGSGTEAAVIAFQKKYGLTQNGLVGETVKNKIAAEAKKNDKPVNPSDPTNPSNPTNPTTPVKQGHATKIKNGAVLNLPKPGDIIDVNLGRGTKDIKAEVKHDNVWTIEYSINACRKAFPGQKCTRRLESAISQFSYNADEYDLLKLNVPEFGTCYAGAMVDGYGQIGDIVEVTLDNDKKFNFMILDTKSTNHTSDELSPNKQCQNKYGHGYMSDNNSKVQLSVCEFIKSKTNEYGAQLYPSGDFLKGRYVKSAQIVGHADIKD